MKTSVSTKDNRARGGGLRHADNQRQQTPRRHVVGGRAGESDDSELGLADATVSQDTSEYRECGDRHRHADEECEAGERDVVRRQPREQVNREHRSQHEWRDDAGVRDEDRRLSAPADQIGVEAEADEEHIEDHAYLGD
jgi:hypothetical protein